MYKNILERIQNEVKTELNKIEAVHNFEFGVEYEIALCNILRKVLPESYGVSRGYVVSKDDNVAGDDIIIYNRLIFPELRFIEKDDYVNKQYIPCEAVCVYIECKNTIELEKLDEKDSIKNALDQIRKVRNLLDKREKRKWNEFDRYVIQKKDTIEKEYYLPNYRNPPYTILLSRNYSIKNKKKENYDNNEVIESIRKIENKVDFNAIDFQLINENFIITRCMENNKGSIQPNIFNINGSSIGCFYNVKAYGLLISIILHICDFINLKPINWVEIINEETNRVLKTMNK